MNRTIYVDVDGTICTSRSLKNINPEEYKDIQSDYENAKPHIERIDYINSLYEKGDNIIYWTARGSVSGIDLKEFTKNQLKEWGAKYHDLDVGKKPHFDMYICDKSYNSESFFQRTLNELP
tara:strand:+ start:317 stop:679 length:363 start_codon:yes stop_codon:yes gene_type:complete